LPAVDWHIAARLAALRNVDAWQECCALVCG
jgi:hypothetical protein